MQDAIEHIMKDFYWKGVHTAMVALNWRWSAGVAKEGIPTVEELKATARSLLNDVTKHGYNAISTGGFTATHDRGKLTLEFVVARSEYDTKPGD